MILSVIGAGFGRTGTLSIKAALETLGLGSCHHMEEVFTQPDEPFPHVNNHEEFWQSFGAN